MILSLFAVLVKQETKVGFKKLGPFMQAISSLVLFVLVVDILSRMLC